MLRSRALASARFCSSVIGLSGAGARAPLSRVHELDVVAFGAADTAGADVFA
jgi:hypothetical protein